MGCPLIVTMEDGAVASSPATPGPRGDAYAPQGGHGPHRIVTSTVRVTRRHLGHGQLQTRSDIPKGKIFDVVRALKDVEVPAPITIGQVLAENVAGTGVDIIATKNIAHA